MPKIINAIGMRFGRLTAISEAEMIAGRKAYLCKCDCGSEKVIRSAYLQSENTRSCGCMRSESNAKTGAGKINPDAKRRTAIYKRWGTMKQRCENPANPFYKNYGGRGIYVCSAWHSFDAFLADMGQPPTPKHTLERMDNNGPYSPENCRWALRSEQLRNQRRTILIDLDGEVLAAKDWSEMLGVSYQSVTKAFRRGGIEAATLLLRSAM